MRDVERCDLCSVGRVGKVCPLAPRAIFAGAVVCFAGDPVTEIRFVKRGTLLTSGGEVRGPGALIGLEGLLGEPARATSWMPMGGILCATPVEDFARWLDAPAWRVIEDAFAHGHTPPDLHSLKARAILIGLPAADSIHVLLSRTAS